MRILTTLGLIATLTACSSTQPQPTPAPTPTAPASAEHKAAPQCWSGDHSKFFDAGTKTAISGVNVECKATSDGKAASWVGGGKH